MQFSSSPSPLLFQRIRLLNTPIDALSLREAVARLQELIAQSRGGLVCTPDTTALWRAQKDPSLRAIYEEADLITPDGTGVVWASRLLGMALPERVSGIDLLERFFAGAHTGRVFLLGAAPGVAERAALKLWERYPNLQIVGTHHGYFRPDENEQIISLIHQAQPDLVLVGLGVPRQELWMQENREKLNRSVLMGVGGCFDVWAGRLMRAPLSWQRLGLEWLYRLLQEPKRLARALTIPLFVLEVWALKLTHLWWR
jgi:N-acetylglucosaminyldiphosphoundecaprenol N-acetyl-beta-D-mannosaminyltransferase